MQGRYISPGVNQNNNAAGPGLAPHRPQTGFRASYYVDMNLSYTVELGGKDLQLYANVTNLFDKDPPITPYWGTFGNNAIQTNGGLFDTLGRRFVIGARVKL